MKFVSFILCLLAGVALAYEPGEIVLPQKTEGGWDRAVMPPTPNTLWSINGSGVLVPIAQSTFALASHNQAWSTITATPTTLAGYGIADGQPLDSDLTALAALSTTSYGRSLITLGDAAAVRSALGLGSMAVQAANAVAISGGTISMPSYEVSGDGSVDTIAEEDNGVGWADDYMTWQTPAGALQFYTEGSPVEGMMFWPGKMEVAEIITAQFSGQIAGQQVTSGVLPNGVVMASMSQPMISWQDGSEYAGANGLTFVTGSGVIGQHAQTPGDYLAVINVADGGGTERNDITGKVKTPLQMSLAQRVAVPADASATGSLGQWAVDATHLYLCTATNTWRRIAHDTW